MGDEERQALRGGVLVATVERSGVIKVLDRHGVHGEPMAWISERVHLLDQSAGYTVVHRPTRGNPFTHVAAATLKKAQAVSRVLASLPRRAR